MFMTCESISNKLKKIGDAGLDNHFGKLTKESLAMGKENKKKDNCLQCKL